MADQPEEWSTTMPHREARLHKPQPASEELLRLADSWTVFLHLAHGAEAEWGDDAPPWLAAGISALEHALKGDSGCVEPAEFEADRRRALADYGIVCPESAHPEVGGEPEGWTVYVCRVCGSPASNPSVRCPGKKSHNGNRYDREPTEVVEAASYAALAERLREAEKMLNYWHGQHAEQFDRAESAERRLAELVEWCRAQADEADQVAKIALEVRDSDWHAGAASALRAAADRASGETDGAA